MTVKSVRTTASALQQDADHAPAPQTAGLAVEVPHDLDRVGVTRTRVDQLARTEPRSCAQTSGPAWPNSGGLDTPVHDTNDRGIEAIELDADGKPRPKRSQNNAAQTIPQLRKTGEDDGQERFGVFVEVEEDR